MSLIEEALRKQREETERGTPAPASPPPPPAPEEVPAPVEEESTPEIVRRPWRLLAGLTLGGILAVILIVWLLIFGLKLWHKQDVPLTGMRTAPPIATNKPAPPIPAATGITSTAAATRVTVTVPETRPTGTNTVPVAASTGLVVTATTPPVKSGGPVGIPPQPAPVPIQATPATKGSSTPAEPVKILTGPGGGNVISIPVAWPRLTVSGIIGNIRSGRCAAIINGQTLAKGDSIEGVRVEGIENQKVKLSFNHEVKLVAVGATTE